MKKVMYYIVENEKRIAGAIICLSLGLLLFILFGCQGMTPEQRDAYTSAKEDLAEAEKKVIKAEENIRLAVESSDKIRTEIKQILDDVGSGKITTAESIPKLLVLKEALIATGENITQAVLSASEAKADLVEAHQKLKKAGVPWYAYVLAGVSAIAGIGIGLNKYGGVCRAVQLLIRLIESSMTTEDVERKAQKIDNPVINKAVAVMKRNAVIVKPEPVITIKKADTIV